MKMISQSLSPSQAVYGFRSWLTTQDEPTVMSSKDDRSAVADRVDAFVKKQKLQEPRQKWTDDLIPMKQTVKRIIKQYGFGPRASGMLGYEVSGQGKVNVTDIEARFPGSISKLLGKLRQNNVISGEVKPQVYRKSAPDVLVIKASDFANRQGLKQVKLKFSVNQGHLTAVNVDNNSLSMWWDGKRWYATRQRVKARTNLKDKPKPGAGRL